MNTPKVKGYYEHPMSRWSIAVRIEDPWHPGDYFLYRMPETLSANDDRYIWQPKGALCWDTVQPDAAPEWSIDNDESETHYGIRFYNGVDLSASVKVVRNEIEFSYSIKNGTEHSLSASTQSCFMIWNAPRFIDRRHERTFIWMSDAPVSVRDLTPTPEEVKKMSWVKIGVRRPLGVEGAHMHCWPANEIADNGLVCVKSRDGKHAIGLAWANAGHIMARSTIPCLHSEPIYPSLRPGDTVEATGKLYLSDGDLSSIPNRFRDDLKSESLRVRIVS